MPLLLMTSFLTVYQRYQSLHSIQEASQARDNEQWLSQDKKNPHTAAHFGNYAYKPQGTLAFFDNGIGNYAGSVVWLEAHKTNFAQNRPAQDNGAVRSEEHTSELQSLMRISYAVFCLKKNNKK